MKFSYDDLANFYIPSSTKTIPLPEQLRPMKTCQASLYFKGSYNNFDSEVHLISGVGNVDLDVSRQKTGRGDNVFSGRIDADRVNAGLIANARKYVGSLDLNADFTVRFPKHGNIDLAMKGKAYHAEVLGHRSRISLTRFRLSLVRASFLSASSLRTRKVITPAASSKT